MGSGSSSNTNFYKQANKPPFIYTTHIGDIDRMMRLTIKIPYINNLVTLVYGPVENPIMTKWKYSDSVNVIGLHENTSSLSSLSDSERVQLRDMLDSKNAVVECRINRMHVEDITIRVV